MEEKELLEKLSELEHEQWRYWITKIIKEIKSLQNQELYSSEIIEYFIKKWKRNNKPYNQLSEDTKEFDRVWARKVLDVIKNEL